MFSQGNKIIVTGSSINSNKIGPRVGSLGYVQRVDKYFIDFDSYSALSAYIIFYKFGNEKKYRVEPKQVLFIVPKRMKTISDFNLSSQQSFINRIHKGKINFTNNFGTNTLCTLCPVYTKTSLKNTNLKERTAYMSSLWGNTLNLSIKDPNLIYWSHRFKIKDIKTIMTMLSQGLIKNSLKHDYISGTIKNDKMYTDFISIIKLLTLRYKGILRIEYVYDQNCKLLPLDNFYNKMYKSLCLNLFSNHYNHMAKKYIYDEEPDSINRKKVETIFKNLNYVKHKLTSIGEEYNLN